MNHIGQAYRNLITESRESKERSKVRAFLQNGCGRSPQNAIAIDREIHNSIRNYGVGDWKFAKAIAKRFVEGQIRDQQTMVEFDKSLAYLNTEPHLSEYDEDLNGLSVQEFVEKFKTMVVGDLNADMERSNSV